MYACRVNNVVNYMVGNRYSEVVFLVTKDQLK